MQNIDPPTPEAHELAVGLDGDHPVLGETAGAVGASPVDRDDRRLEMCRSVDERRLQIADPELNGGTGGVGDHIGGGEHDVEGGGQRGAVHAARRTLERWREGGLPSGDRRIEVEHERRGEWVARSDDHVEGHGGGQ